MRKVYFVRHAKPDFSVKDDFTRPLLQSSLSDCKKITKFLLNKNITKIFSSPYKRSIDTIKDLANSLNLKINYVYDFRERKIDNIWIENFNEFSKKQWNDFDYKLSNGESLKEVQKRNIEALVKILDENSDENIVIGTHGTALSTIINYFDNKFNYNEFEKIKSIMPFIVCFTFDKGNVISIEKIIL